MSLRPAPPLATSRSLTRLGTREVDRKQVLVQKAEYFVEQFYSKSKSNLN